MPSFEIRPAGNSDIPAITDIYAHHVETRLESFEETPPSRDEMARRMQLIIGGNHPYLVATKDDAVTGYAYAGSFASRIAYRYTVEDSIYLHPDFLGQGMGKALLQELINQSSERGFRQMIAIITRLDPPVSVKLHEKLGFTTCGILENVGYKAGRWLDVIYMQRALGAGGDEDPMS